MTTREFIHRLRGMQYCDCRIDAHCLGEIKQLQDAARMLMFDRPTVLLRRLRMIQRCRCYFASHCIDRLCALTEDFSKDLREARAQRRRAA